MELGRQRENLQVCSAIRHLEVCVEGREAGQLIGIKCREGSIPGRGLGLLLRIVGADGTF